MIVRTYPNHIIFGTIVKDGYIDENGNYIGEQYEFNDDFSVECDVVPASGKYAEVEYEDGVSVKASYVVYMKPNPNFSCKHGDRVQIERYGEVMEKQVLGIAIYQHQIKLWV